ncbi:MAG: GAF domain-containing protein [Actinobacteria bacterium]|nr:GAF domain-containing protein [Actinomycetota bacterium]
MADTDDPHAVDSPDPADRPSPTDVNWPLVERRRPGRRSALPAGTIDARSPDGVDGTPSLTVSAPMWPFRLLALAGAVVQGRDDLSSENWQLWVALAVAALYAVFAIVRPIPHRDDHRIRLRVVVEYALHTGLVMLTGAWTSPLALTLIPSVMVAGFAAGSAFAAQLIVASLVVVTVQHVPDAGVATGARDAAMWAGLLGVVAFTTGLSQRAALDAARQKEAAIRRVNRLSEANSLLFALQRVAQSMPASLDLDDVVDSTLSRVRALVPCDSLALYLLDDTDGRLDVFRNTGNTAQAQMTLSTAPSMVRAAIDAPRTVRIADLPAGTGLSPSARSGLYAALRARGTMVGLLAVESDRPEGLTQQHTEILHGLAEPFGIAIDNSRLFRRIRSTTVSEERRRIARDLHDQVGSSLAFLGFEVDRAQELAAQGRPVDEVLVDLRQQVTAVVNEIRETLHDLRTDVTDQRDLPATLRDHLARVGDRRQLRTEAHVDAPSRPPRQVERELWQIALEAITNVERHAQATTVRVTYLSHPDRVLLQVSDDGIGLNNGPRRADRYGMIGMRERTHGIGASLRVESTPGGGTTIAVELDPGEVRS